MGGKGRREGKQRQREMGGKTGRDFGECYNYSWHLRLSESRPLHPCTSEIMWCT